MQPMNLHWVAMTKKNLERTQKATERKAGKRLETSTGLGSRNSPGKFQQNSTGGLVDNRAIGRVSDVGKLF